MTSAEKPETIWFNPPKFWAATKQMSPKDASELLDQVMFLAELKDFDALRKFEFVSVGPHRRRPIKA